MGRKPIPPGALIECTGGCKRTLAFTSEYFASDTHRGKARLRTICKDCQRAYKNRKYREKHPAKPALVTPGTVLVIKAEYQDGKLVKVLYDLVSDKTALAELLKALQHAA